MGLGKGVCWFGLVGLGCKRLCLPGLYLQLPTPPLTTTIRLTGSFRIKTHRPVPCKAVKNLRYVVAVAFTRFGRRGERSRDVVENVYFRGVRFVFCSKAMIDSH